MGVRGVVMLEQQRESNREKQRIRKMLVSRHGFPSSFLSLYFTALLTFSIVFAKEQVRQNTLNILVFS